MEGKDTPELEEARRQLIEAEDEYRRSPTGDYVTMVIRDSAVVEAHRRGMSTDEIRKLVPDLGDRHRAVTRREVVPGGFLSPAEAVRVSRLGPRAFVTAVRDGRIQPVEVFPGVLAFRPEDIDGLRSTAQAG